MPKKGHYATLTFFLGGGGQKGPPSLKPVTHPTMMKLGTVILYVKDTISFLLNF